MKRLWFLPVLLLLAAPVCAQEDGDDATAVEATPSGDPAPDTNPTPAQNDLQPPQSGDDGNDDERADEPAGQSADKVPDEAPIISVKMAGPNGEEMEDAALQPPGAEKKVVPTATIKPARRTRRVAAVKPKTKAMPVRNARVKTPPVEKKAPAPAAPPPPPEPAVPLTPVTPRNP